MNLFSEARDSCGSEISGDNAVWDMAEFFIVRGYRRVELGPTKLTACGGSFRGGGKFASWSPTAPRASFGSVRLRCLPVRRRIPFESKKMASAGTFSHLNPRISSNNFDLENAPLLVEATQPQSNQL